MDTTATAPLAEVLRDGYRSRLLERLQERAGPVEGNVDLPLHTVWSGRTSYRLDRPLWSSPADRPCAPPAWSNAPAGTSTSVSAHADGGSHTSRPIRSAAGFPVTDPDTGEEYEADVLKEAFRAPGQTPCGTRSLPGRRDRRHGPCPHRPRHRPFRRPQVQGRQFLPYWLPERRCRAEPALIPAVTAACVPGVSRRVEKPAEFPGS